ncbi:hypothetical protein ACFOOM_07520 [Streptomyces echinoruber]|uniref:Uncharacterized protein n=1 Tax=Streptomyces echinoruber TaxID=68898 RepID=A0A918R2J7_9ACTN|nr:hypothetical protein [Streptomyces echinoruber]GGZ80206.1 hypothetical protein GCM10010389_17420 [Streptomyces echinoruber]
MRPEMITALTALAVALVTAAGGIATAVIGRRQPRRAHRRDDFTVITDRLGQHIERLERRLDEQEQESERDRARITAQDFTIRYLAAWVRSLVSYIRSAQLEPPPPPQPVPAEVQPYLHDVGL